jgi:hypothetical protein
MLNSSRLCKSKHLNESRQSTTSKKLTMWYMPQKLALREKYSRAHHLIYSDAFTSFIQMLCGRNILTER